MNSTGKMERPSEANGTCVSMTRRLISFQQKADAVASATLHRGADVMGAKTA